MTLKEACILVVGCTLLRMFLKDNVTYLLGCAVLGSVTGIISGFTRAGK